MTTTPPPLLHLEAVYLHVGDELFLDDVDLVLEPGESVAMVVPHARTTLLEVAAGLMPPDRGEVRLHGVPIERALADTIRGPRIGFVFQEGGLLENTPLFDNVALPVRYHEAPSAKSVSARVMRALELVGIPELAFRFPYQVTSGQQRLAALARALVVEPELVFVDDLYRGASQETWDRFVRAMDHAKREHRTAFLSVMAVADAPPPGVDRIVRVKKRVVRASPR